MVACQDQGILAIIQLWGKMKYRDNSHKPTRQQKNPLGNTKLNKAFFKEHPFSKHHDKKHGFICKDNLRNECKYARVNYHTFKNNVNRMVDLGLLIPTFTGWRVVSIKTAGTIVGVEIDRLRIKAKTLEELKNKIALSVINKSIVIQDKIHSEKSANEVSILSLKTIAARTGYKSATTAKKRVAKLESIGKIKVGRDDRIMITHDYFGNTIYKYPCNSYKKIA